MTTSRRSANVSANASRDDVPKVRTVSQLAELLEGSAEFKPAPAHVVHAVASYLVLRRIVRPVEDGLCIRGDLTPLRQDDVSRDRLLQALLEAVVRNNESQPNSWVAYFFKPWKSHGPGIGTEKYFETNAGEVSADVARAAAEDVAKAVLLFHEQRDEMFQSVEAMLRHDAAVIMNYIMQCYWSLLATIAERFTPENRARLSSLLPRWTDLRFPESEQTTSADDFLEEERARRAIDETKVEGADTAGGAAALGGRAHPEATVDGAAWGTSALLLLETEPQSKDLLYGDSTLGTVDRAKYGTAKWALLSVLNRHRGEVMHLSDLASEVDLIRARANLPESRKADMTEDQHGPDALSGDEQFAGTQHVVRSRSGGRTYSGDPPEDLRERFQAVLRRRTGDAAKRWRRRWLQWTENTVTLEFRE